MTGGRRGRLGLDHVGLYMPQWGDSHLMRSCANIISKDWYGIIYVFKSSCNSALVGVGGC